MDIIESDSLTFFERIQDIANWIVEKSSELIKKFKKAEKLLN